MIKIKTLFKKNPQNLALVINEIDPDNQWAIDGEGTPTKKYDGTACMVKNRQLYKRYDAKINRKTGMFKTPPIGSIPCQEPDSITGHWPHWVLCDRNDPADKRHFEAFDLKGCNYEDGTYELVGPGIQNNPENYDLMLVKHFSEDTFVELPCPITFEDLKSFLEEIEIEGIVFHHPDGRMCKIRRSDFGLKWNGK